MTTPGTRRGPLRGLRVVELAGQGPLPFAATMLADHGAEVIRVVRPGTPAREDPGSDVFGRSRRTIVLDLKHPEGYAAIHSLIETADVLLEGYRPGVLERIGLDPEQLLERHPKLVVGRMTGWGQTGPLAQSAGHDLNYLGLTGLLDAIGEPGRAPVPPLNLVADYGGGGMLLAFGVLAALYRVQHTGRGDIIDAAMVDGASLLGGIFYSLADRGVWGPKGTNTIDGGAHFYRAYRTSDGLWMTVAAIEPEFYANLLQVLGIDAAEAPQREKHRWPELSERFAEVFAARTQAEWSAQFGRIDACVAPVTTLSNATEHPHIHTRGVIREISGHRQPAPAPRYLRATLEEPTAAQADGHHARELLAEVGWSSERIHAAILAGGVAEADDGN